MSENRKHITVKFSKAKLGRRNKGLAILHDVGSDLTSSLSLREILDRAVRKVSEHYKVDVVRIYLMDESGHQLELAACAGFCEVGTEDLRRIAIGEGFSGKAVRTKSFIAQKVTDLENAARTKLVQGQGFKVIICVPLIVNEEVLGVMNLASKRTVSLTQSDVDLFVAVGNQIAIAVNVARLHEAIKIKAEEIKKKKDEIEFFAYTISHDLKNPTVGIVGMMESILERYGDALDDKLKKYCKAIKKAADQVLRLVMAINEYISATEAALNMEKTDIHKVVEQIRDEVSEVLEKRSIRLLGPEGVREVMADELAMTRVFRNLINNALKHGGDSLSKIAQDRHWIPP
ncbi:MAG: GAF domain-containing protein [Deltaproteobacteria bacterium]|nr:GAF domain-containing protein [Deltaproteobacteria bacterium]